MPSTPCVRRALTFANRVTDNYDTFGGSGGNLAGDDAGSTDDAQYATVGGETQNTASGQYATVGWGASLGSRCSG